MTTRGTNVAAVTPLGAQGDIDFGAAFELIDYLCAAGVQGIVLFDSAGEYPALDHEERLRLVYLAVKRSRVPLWIGVGSASLDHSIGLAREAREAGAEGVLVPPPFFFRYRQDDLLEFYRHFAAQAGEIGSVWLANTPEVASAIAPETALKLLNEGLYGGIEEAGADLDAFRCLQSAAGNGRFGLLAGNDAVLVKARFGDGGNLEIPGGVSEAACAVPELLLALDRAMDAADRPRIERLEAMLAEFLAWANRFPRPALLKVATGLRGVKTGPPAVPLSNGRKRLLDEFGEWFRAWLPVVQRIAANA